MGTLPTVVAVSLAGTGTPALLVCLGATLFMTGVIWFVQVVHYPLFGQMPAPAFPSYHAAHTQTISYVVVAPMVLELVSSLWLAAVSRPTGIGSVLAWSGFAGSIVAWLSTAALQVPAHTRLAVGFDARIHRFLVGSNWVRTIAWTAHAAIMLAMIGQLLPWR